MYTNSNGEQIKVESLHSEHLINALSKKMKEIFNSTSYDEYNVKLNEINALKEEYYKRLNQFVEKIGK